MTIATTPKNLIRLSVLLLALAAVFSVLNNYKVKSLQNSVSQALSARDSAENRRIAQEGELKKQATSVVAATPKADENKAAQAEADFVKFQAEKEELQAKLQAKENQIVELERRVEETTTKSSINPGAPSPTELQAQLDDARNQLDLAEREKKVLSDKVHVVQERSVQIEDDRKRRAAVSAKAGVRGTILAVNQAYNFVVLNLGGRNGVEPNSEMLIVRSGTLIGKIRVSSVEPSTAIGDIITSSLARGVQVQPGDIVIYGGNS